MKKIKLDVDSLIGINIDDIDEFTYYITSECDVTAIDNNLDNIHIIGTKLVEVNLYLCEDDFDNLSFIFDNGLDYQIEIDDIESVKLKQVHEKFLKEEADKIEINTRFFKGKKLNDVFDFNYQISSSGLLTIERKYYTTDSPLMEINRETYFDKIEEFKTKIQQVNFIPRENEFDSLDLIFERDKKIRIYFSDDDSSIFQSFLREQNIDIILKSIK